MFSTKSKIKLGKPVEPPVASRSAAGSGPSPSTPRSGKGFSLEKDRVDAAQALDVSLRAAQPQVNPVILIAALGAVLVLFVALLFGPGGGGSDFDTQAVVRDYIRYRNSKPNGANRLEPEQVRRLLNDAEHLENDGRRSAARLVWQTILMSAGNDPDAPLRDLAARHLNALK